MDLLQSVRKEGSRGGRGDFKWEDVKNDQHRENYLGHSLMAPVGRWQTGKDLSWYAKSGTEDGSPSAEDIRKEELRRVKEAEADAMNLALGLPVASKNPNAIALGERRSDADIKKALAQSTDQEDTGGQKGKGFGSYRGRPAGADATNDILEGKDDGRPPKKLPGQDNGRERKRSRSRERHRRRTYHDDDDHRRRRSRSGDRERHHRRRSVSVEDRRHRRYRSRSREQRRHRSRSRGEPRGSDRHGRREDREYRPKNLRRSRSPRRDHRSYRRERD